MNLIDNLLLAAGSRLEPGEHRQCVIQEIRRHRPARVNAGVFSAGESAKYMAGTCAYCHILGRPLRQYLGFIACSPGQQVAMHEHRAASENCLECSGPSAEMGHDPVPWPCAEIKEIAQELEVSM